LTRVGRCVDETGRRGVYFAGRGCVASHIGPRRCGHSAGVLMTGAGVTAASSPQSRVAAALYPDPLRATPCPQPGPRLPRVRLVPGAARGAAARPRVSVPHRACGDLFRAMGEVAEHRAPLVRARGHRRRRPRPAGRSAGRSSSARCAVGSGSRGPLPWFRRGGPGAESSIRCRPRGRDR